MSGNKKNYRMKPSSKPIDADFRIKIEKAIENFVNHSNEMVYEFPASLTNVERAFVHNLAPKYNLKTKSDGRDENRKLSLYKLTENKEFVNRCARIDLDPEALEILRQFSFDSPPIDRSLAKENHIHKQKVTKPLVLSKAPGVPRPSNADTRIQEARRKLPIFSYRDAILEKIEENRILLIQGSTGSGKTTQIPQYILEDASERGRPCRILCTQPRRISAIASADRVCYERSEASSGTIGYQIRLESSISQDTNCIFLTPGVFLRYLSGGSPEKLFNNITHILIDEAHERNKENDFLLTSVKEHFNANPSLRLIIMSATMDTGVFANYFETCEEISIATTQYEVQENYLEDILKLVNYRNSRVDELNRAHQSGQLVETSQSAYVKEQEAAGADLDEETIAFINETLDNLSRCENPESEFAQFAYLVQSENIPVDFRHAGTNMTALMISVGRGCLSTVEMLLNLKADVNLMVNWQGTEINCIDIATQLQGPDSEMRKLLERYIESSKSKVLTSADVYNKALLNIYYDSVLKTKSSGFILEEGIDHELIAQLIEKIHSDTDRDQAILVFLPGYDDIIQLSNLVTARIWDGIALFLLHSSMKTDDQKNVFKQVARGTRKIILSTNIAESSITIDDVVYVIDSGREKLKSYDAMSNSSTLCVQWISKASAKQRKGRAGRLRNGLVFRVYSSDRYYSMLETTIPELLRTSLTEICLQTKLMVGDTMGIEEFLLKCIATPSTPAIRQSIKMLQCLGALDEKERLTLIGSHLAQMPVDAKYGKMLIYGIALKCLNSVLSIVSILSMGDQIFVLPMKPADRYKSTQVRRTIGEGSMSDHFVMLSLFQQWMNVKTKQMNDRKFCEENFINGNSMEHVRGIRGQIMAYLQSSGLMKGSPSSLNTNSGKWPVIKTCLCAGLYPSVARIDRKKKAMFSDIDQKLTFHMSSILCNKNDRTMDFVKKLPSDWAVFEEKNRVGRIAMIRCNTLVNSVSLTMTASASLKSQMSLKDGEDSDEDDEETLFIKIDNLALETTRVGGTLILEIREKLDDLILRFLSLRDFKFEPNDDTLIKTIVQVLQIEEKNSGFPDVSLDEREIIHHNDWRRPQIRNRAYNDVQGNQRSQPNQAGDGQANWRNNDQPRSQPNQGGDGQANWRNNVQQRIQPRNEQYKTSQGSNCFFANNAASASFDRPRFQQSNNRQRYFAMKLNSDRLINEWAAAITFEIDHLNLKPWFLQKLENFTNTQVFIMFYSTTRSEFLGYGDVVQPSGANNLMFHFRLAKKVPIRFLVQNQQLANFNIFQNPMHQIEDLPNNVGTAVVRMLQS